jgi:pimeloyl-ACP methyl ester carboxylesterase
LKERGLLCLRAGAAGIDFRPAQSSNGAKGRPFMLTRRSLLQGAAIVTIAGLSRPTLAADEPVPVVFVHGDSDYAATWLTTIWRFESNGYPRDKLFAISFNDPQARDDDTVAQANRSSTQDQLRELTAFIDDVKKKTSAAKVAIVALSRGGYSTREYVAASPSSVACVVLAARPITASLRSTPCWAANITATAPS